MHQHFGHDIGCCGFYESFIRIFVIIILIRSANSQKNNEKTQKHAAVFADKLTYSIMTFFQFFFFTNIDYFGKSILKSFIVLNKNSVKIRKKY